MEQTEDKVVLGTLGAVYGVKGWLKIQSYTEIDEAIFDYSPWLIKQQGEWRAVQVAEWRRHNKGLIARLAQVNDRDQAAVLTGLEIGVEADALPKLADDEFYWRDLIGMAVVNTDGYHMGVVDQLMATASNDVMVVKANSNDAFGRHERLIPFIQSQYVTAVDSAARQITVDWPADF